MIDMFDQWKKKLKNIFTEEVEVEVEEVVEIKANHSLHNKESKQVETRMMYQYPERNSFRFPVIPDEPTKETTNRPSKIKADQEKTAPAITKDDKREKRTYEDPIRKDRKVYKKIQMSHFSRQTYRRQFMGIKRGSKKMKLKMSLHINERIKFRKGSVMKDLHLSPKIQRNMGGNLQYLP